MKAFVSFLLMSPRNMHYILRVLPYAIRYIRWTCTTVSDNGIISRPFDRMKLLWMHTRCLNHHPRVLDWRIRRKKTARGPRQSCFHCLLFQLSYNCSQFPYRGIISIIRIVSTVTRYVILWHQEHYVRSITSGTSRTLSPTFCGHRNGDESFNETRYYVYNGVFASIAENCLRNGKRRRSDLLFKVKVWHLLDLHGSMLRESSTNLSLERSWWKFAQIKYADKTR